MNSATVAAAQTATAAQYNNLRKDLVLTAGDFATSGGSANAQTLSLDAQIVTSYTTGMAIKFKAGFTNTAACTININSIGANTIKRIDGTDLQPGDIILNGVHIIIYDGTNFKLTNTAMNPLLSGTSGAAIAVGQNLYMKASDSKIYLADGDADESTYSWIGVSQTATSGADETVFFAPPGRIAVGLTSRTVGAAQFISATAGQVDETPHATRYAKIGIGYSSTSILVCYPVFKRTGSSTITTTGTTTITTGFYPKVVRVRAGSAGAGGQTPGISIGDDSNTCVKIAGSGSNGYTSSAWSVTNSLTTTNAGTIINKTQTGFDLNCTTAGGNADVQWEADG